MPPGVCREPRPGSIWNVNRAIQACNAADVDVLALHHQRKGDGTAKPTSLPDVYGSTWITAGAESVVLLWGDPGSEIVELSHLKQPADPVGPLTVEHDHHRGLSTVTRGFDVLAYLRICGPAGSTVSDAAQAEHGSPQKPGGAKWKGTGRRLRRLDRDALARYEPRGQAETGQLTAGRYFALDASSTLDTHLGHGL